MYPKNGRLNGAEVVQLKPLRDIADRRELTVCSGVYTFSGDAHIEGHILAGALWDWRNRIADHGINPIQVDQEVFEILDELGADDEQDVTMLRVRMLLEGTTLGGSYSSDLAWAFDRHNIKTPFDDNCPERPVAQAGESWTDPSGRHFPVAWTPVSAATGYRVYARPHVGTALTLGYVVADSITATSFVDVEPDTAYPVSFGVTTLDSTGAETAASVETPEVTGVQWPSAPADKRITWRAYPSPSRSSVNIEFSALNTAIDRVEIFDVRGRRVLLKWAPDGFGRLRTWDGRDDGGRAVGSGIYLIRFEGGMTHAQIPVAVVR